MACTPGDDIYTVFRVGARSWGLDTFLGWEEVLTFGHSAKWSGVMRGGVCVDCPTHIVESAQSSQESWKGISHLLGALSVQGAGLDSFYA